MNIEQLPEMFTPRGRRLLVPGYVKPRYRKDKKRRPRYSFDLHGVVDATPKVFRTLFAALIAAGCEVHIVTGAPWEKEKDTLKKLRMPFTHFFSIVDYHVSVGTPIRWDKKGNAHLEPYLWDQTKGLYCRKHRVLAHFDDSDAYGYAFTTPFIRFYSKDTHRIKKIHTAV